MFVVYDFESMSLILDVRLSHVLFMPSSGQDYLLQLTLPLAFI